MSSRGHLADRLPALLDVAQGGPGGVRVAGVDLLGLVEQRPLGGGVRVELGVALREVLRRGGRRRRPARCGSAATGCRRRPSGARPAAFHSVIRSRKRAAVGPQSSESASFSASSASSSLRARAPDRCRSRSAKCEPRRRLKASRALEKRFHSASSVLRSMPRMVRHSSRIALNRSPACFHCVASTDSVSASAASVLLARDRRVTRAASRSARCVPTACSACATSAVEQRAQPHDVADDVRLGQARRAGRARWTACAWGRRHPTTAC